MEKQDEGALRPSSRLVAGDTIVYPERIEKYRKAAKIPFEARRAASAADWLQSITLFEDRHILAIKPAGVGDPRRHGHCP